MLKGLGAKWLAFDVGVPFGLSAVVGLLAHSLSIAGDFGVYVRLGCGAAWVLVAFALTIAASPALRAAVLQYSRVRT